MTSIRIQQFNSNQQSVIAEASGKTLFFSIANVLGPAIVVEDDSNHQTNIFQMDTGFFSNPASLTLLAQPGPAVAIPLVIVVSDAPIASA